MEGIGCRKEPLEAPSPTLNICSSVIELWVGETWIYDIQEKPSHLVNPSRCSQNCLIAWTLGLKWPAEFKNLNYIHLLRSTLQCFQSAKIFDQGSGKSEAQDSSASIFFSMGKYIILTGPSCSLKVSRNLSSDIHWAFIFMVKLCLCSDSRVTCPTKASCIGKRLLWKAGFLVRGRKSWQTGLENQWYPCQNHRKQRVLAIWPLKNRLFSTLHGCFLVQ